MSTYFKEEQENLNSSDNIITKIWRYYQGISDKIQYYKKERWTLIGFLTLIFLLRLYVTNGIIFLLI